MLIERQFRIARSPTSYFILLMNDKLMIEIGDMNTQQGFNSAGSASEGETDFSVIKEIKNSLSELEAELKEVNEKKLEGKQKLLTKILTPDA